MRLEGPRGHFLDYDAKKGAMRLVNPEEGGVKNASVVLGATHRLLKKLGA